MPQFPYVHDEELEQGGPRLGHAAVTVPLIVPDSSPSRYLLPCATICLFYAYRINIRLRAEV